MDNGDGSREEICKGKRNVERGLEGLNNAKSGLRGDKEEVENGYNELSENIDRRGKRGGSMRK
ncbi:hypothetical protein [Staphylococcus epidermidis]|uniref:hypothetical protein n=1 Tax=Staphylococcus epidermidis TaxID=1282 RepID=UPI0011A9F48E|nr:hypothetical protein [Staphylococcus epidermidis]